MESIPSFLGAGVLLFMAGSAIVGLLMGGIVSVPQCRAEKLAPARRPQPVAKGRARCDV